MKNRELKNKNDKNESGFALLGALAFLMLFVVLTAFAIDFFTIIHTGIVNSIAARTYLFETVAHRSDIAHLRFSDDDPSTPTVARNDFTAEHYRFHAVSDEDQGIDDNSAINAPGRGLTMVLNDDSTDAGDWKTPNDNRQKTPVVWIKTGYGICVDAHCN
jgi:hypothetical protein